MITGEAHRSECIHYFVVFVIFNFMINIDIFYSVTKNVRKSCYSFCFFIPRFYVSNYASRHFLLVNSKCIATHLNECIPLSSTK